MPPDARPRPRRVAWGNRRTATITALACCGMLSTLWLNSRLQHAGPTGSDDVRSHDLRLREALVAELEDYTTVLLHNRAVEAVARDYEDTGALGDDNNPPKGVTRGAQRRWMRHYEDLARAHGTQRLRMPVWWWAPLLTSGGESFDG